MNLNPQAIVNMMMQKNPQFRSNPIVQNALNMAQNNNVNGLQSLAQNICKEKGADINQVQQQIKQMFGFK